MSSRSGVATLQTAIHLLLTVDVEQSTAQHANTLTHLLNYTRLVAGKSSRDEVKWSVLTTGEYQRVDRDYDRACHIVKPQSRNRTRRTRCLILLCCPGVWIT